jgi:hypothetical protein
MVGKPDSGLGFVYLVGDTTDLCPVKEPEERDCPSSEGRATVLQTGTLCTPTWSNKGQREPPLHTMAVSVPTGLSLFSDGPEEGRWGRVLLC